MKRKTWSEKHLEQLIAEFRQGETKGQVAKSIRRFRPGTTENAVWSAWVHKSTRDDRRARRKARSAS